MQEVLRVNKKYTCSKMKNINQIEKNFYLFKIISIFFFIVVLFLIINNITIKADDIYTIKEIIFVETNNLNIEKLYLFLPVKKGDKIDIRKIDNKCKYLYYWLKSNGNYFYIEVFYELDLDNREATIFISLIPQPSFIKFLKNYNSSPVLFNFKLNKNNSVGLTAGSNFPYDYFGLTYSFNLQTGEFITAIGYQNWNNSNAIKTLISLNNNIPYDIYSSIFLNYIYFFDSNVQSLLSTGFYLKLDKRYLSNIYIAGFMLDLYYEKSFTYPDFTILSSKIFSIFKPISFIEISSSLQITNFYDINYIEYINYYLNNRDNIKIETAYTYQYLIQILNTFRLKKLINLNLFNIFTLNINPVFFIDFIATDSTIFDNLNYLKSEYIKIAGTGLEFVITGFVIKFYFVFNLSENNFSFKILF